MKPKQAANSAAYEAILRAGPRLNQLQQAHAHLIVTGHGHTRSLLTKLITFACSAKALAYAHLIFLSVPLPDDFLFNTVIKSTSKSRFPLDCLAYYRRMLSSSDVSPSNYTFTSVIKSCADLSAVGVGKGVHCHAVVTGFGFDSYVQAALVAFYAKCGDVGVARKVFDEMPVKSVVAWNSLVSGLEQNGLGEEAIRVFYQMRDSGLEPDSATFVSVLAACAQTGGIGLGSWVHRYIVDKGFEMNVKLGTALVNLYSRCGDVGKARGVFDEMEETNVAAWTAMISAYGTHGCGKQAVDLFNKMEDEGGPVPNDVTFVAVLSACAHGGLVEEGRSVYKRMSKRYGLVPRVEHHVCMVDMLGRAGFLDEAYRFIHQLDATGKASSPALWTAMLGACKMHRSYDLGVEIAKRLIALEPENPGHHVMLSNIYALSGKTDEVSHVRDRMIKNNLRKQVGYSVIEVEKKTYLFSMGDESHPETREIYRYLETLMSRCKEIGYAPVSEEVMHQVEEEEKEYALRYHSEKLAVAFGLLKTVDVAITVVKNLRICEDCHSAFKYISIVSNRQIIVRDKLRFHHFQNGSCSCLDYW
ncbi:Pentatricopeptide repeat-containing protein [Raphanus sativus]|uniref:Pentatricopeptide repeat-containing protein At2g33760 n=1 Tax=Raphanus sativus TaxID=3726 RepID=A0A6J0NG48_RAPSA|nr:pentatricopeptide repeat-containing protein At2g33760 [Raphanus sativus]KAJ4903533.1 Pentatricopeptide repeat-containing protein [Raphanus sativus]